MLLPSSRLMEWIAEGNTLIQLSRMPTDLMSALSVPFISPSANHQREVSEIEDYQEQMRPPDGLPTSPLHSSGKWKLALRAPLTFSRSSTDRWKPIAFYENLAVVGEMSYGKGRLIVVGDPDILTNFMILDDENLMFLADMTGKNDVIFDEFSHGLGREGTIVGMIKEFNLIPFLLQVVFVFILYGFAVRAVRATSVSSPVHIRSTLKQIDTLAGLYHSTLLQREIDAKTRGEVVRRLSKILKCAPMDVERKIMGLKGADQQCLVELYQESNENSFPPSTRGRKNYVAALLTKSHHLLKEYIYERNGNPHNRGRGSRGNPSLQGTHA